MHKTLYNISMGGGQVHPLAHPCGRPCLEDLPFPDVVPATSASTLKQQLTDDNEIVPSAYDYVLLYINSLFTLHHVSLQLVLRVLFSCLSDT